MRAAAPRLRPRPVRRPAPLLPPTLRAAASPATLMLRLRIRPPCHPRAAVTGSMRAAAPVLGLGGCARAGRWVGTERCRGRGPGAGACAWAPAPTRGELPPRAAGTAGPPRSEGSGSGPARCGRFSPQQGALRCPPPIGGWQMAPAPSAPLCLPPAGSVSAKRALPKPHKYLLGISSTCSGQRRDV